MLLKRISGMCRQAPRATCLLSKKRYPPDISLAALALASLHVPAEHYCYSTLLFFPICLILLLGKTLRAKCSMEAGAPTACTRSCNKSAARRMASIVNAPQGNLASLACASLSTDGPRVPLSYMRRTCGSR